ncbi:MFS transporter [Cellvibrio sp. KY-GH-1]|uniref:MFS transporter n=1 Tax=Cellvibrio sp. KY-GH-1 TaxID=2303332 RepID=UPI001245EC61|nr:MFS transporter [Cellvibrio sp. KY-GH-1]QEY17087.1 MFS transporter [Cellvibrio sp. KY-GH-1]
MQDSTAGAVTGTPHKLSIGEKIGYSLGDAAANFVWRSGFFIPVFYTDTFGIAAAHATILILIVRLSDGITDIMMGSIADRTKTKQGKFRPWILWSTPFLALFLSLIFTTPDLSYTGKVIYAFVIYFCLTLAYTANNVPYGALMGVMTDSVTERASLSSFRFIGAFTGGLLVMTSLPELVEVLGKGSEAVGYQRTMLIFSVLLIVFLFITYKTTKERIEPPTQIQGTFWEEMKDLFCNLPVILIPVFGISLFIIALAMKEWSATVKVGALLLMLASFAYTVHLRKKIITRPIDSLSPTQKDLADLLTNKPWLILLGVGIMFGLFTVVRPSAASYYFKYYLERSDLISLYFLLTLLASLAAAVATGWLSSRFNKRTLMIAAFVLGAIFNGAIYFVPRENVNAMLALATIGEFFAGMMPVLFFSMLGDTVDYSEWKNHRRATGLIYSAGTFINKTGHGFAGAMVLIVLALYGYDATIQSAVTASLPAMVLLMTGIPVIIGILGTIFTLWYPLDDKTMKNIESELIARRVKNNAQ